MNRVEATQYGADGVAVMAGADVDFQQPQEMPCDDCGGLVDLSSTIKFTVMEADGTESAQEMSEADARALLASVGVPPPPVLCDAHGDEGEIVTEAV